MTPPNNQNESDRIQEALVKQQLDRLVQDFNDLNTTVKSNDKNYYMIFITKTDFLLVRTLVYGFAGMILVAFAAAMVKFVIR